MLFMTSMQHSLSSSYIFSMSCHRRDGVESTAARLTQGSIDKSMPKPWLKCKALKQCLAMLSGIWIAIQGPGSRPREFVLVYQP